MKSNINDVYVKRVLNVCINIEQPKNNIILTK